MGFSNQWCWFKASWRLVSSSPLWFLCTSERFDWRWESSPVVYRWESSLWSYCFCNRGRKVRGWLFWSFSSACYDRRVVVVFMTQMFECIFFLQIFMTGWWLCPELYLRRPFDANFSSRLDALLEAKAKQGVQVKINSLSSFFFSFFNILVYQRLLIVWLDVINWLCRYIFFYTKRFLLLWKSTVHTVKEGFSKFMRMWKYCVIRTIFPRVSIYGML